MGPAGLDVSHGIMSGIANACLSCLSTVDRWCHITACVGPIGGRSRDGIYETTLADNEREAVSDLLGYLENVCCYCLFRPGMDGCPLFCSLGPTVIRSANTVMLAYSVPKPTSFRANRFDL